MSGNMARAVVTAVFAMISPLDGSAEDFAPEPVSPLAMEPPYDGFVMDNEGASLAAFRRLRVRVGGRPADGLESALHNWRRLEWVLPTPQSGPAPAGRLRRLPAAAGAQSSREFIVSLVCHSGDKRPGKFGYVVRGKEYASKEFRLSGYRWGSMMVAFQICVPEGQIETRMSVTGNGLYVRRVAFSRVTRPIKHKDGKIRNLAGSSYRTVLSRRSEQPGRPSCVVLVPDSGPERAQARKLARRLRLPSREEPAPRAPFPAYPPVDRAGADTSLILLRVGPGGALARAMHRAGLIPGGEPGEYRIRTVARPFRGKANVIVISASDLSALAQACEAFAGLVADTTGERVYDKFLTFPPGPSDAGRPVHVRDSRAADDPWWQKREDGLTKPQCGITWSSPARGLLSRIGRLAGAYWNTGNERYAELLRRYVFRMEEDRAYTTYGDGHDAHMALSSLIHAWDRVEEASVFSQADRLRITNHLLWCLDSDQGFPRSGGYSHYGGTVRMRHNHQTILGQGMMAAYLYFSRLYDLGLTELWKAWCDDLIENGTAWGHAPEDSALYEPGTFREVAEMLHYEGLSTKGAKGTEHWPRTLLRFLAAVDSFGFPAAYGDCWASFQVTATSFFRVMAEDWGWPAGQFVIDHRIRGFRHARPEDRIASGHNGSTEVGGTRPPSDPRAVSEALKPLLGLAALPMGREYYEYMAGRIGNDVAWRGHARPPAPPYDKTADKIQYRSGWGPQHEYLLFETSGWGNHGHMDLGAMIHYCEGARLWIVDSGYANSGPEHHSMLDLWRDGVHAWQKRENPGSLSWSGFRYEGQQMMEIVDVQPRRPGIPGPFRFTARVNDYAGATWERTVAGGAGKGLQIQDVVTAEKPGEYEAAFRLRFLGALEGGGGRWTVRQKGAELPVALQTVAGDRVTAVEAKSDKKSFHHTGLYPGYAFVEGGGVPKVVEWRRRIRLKAGERTVFRATLGPSEPPASRR